VALPSSCNQPTLGLFKVRLLLNQEKMCIKMSHPGVGI